ncbi:MAG TPA: hypothetical protein VLT58_17800, partial [Polyangia bacterium]|nr:hypothetical protein [Polyangia bacterium]
AGAGGAAGAAGGQGGAGGNAGAAGGSAGAGGAGGGLAMCGTDTRTSQGLECLTNTVDATGPCVTATISNNPTPAATGGTIVAGTYDLISITAYSGDAGTANVLSPVRKTIVLTGTASPLTLQEADLSGSFLSRQSGTVTTSGTNALTFTQSCPTVDGGANVFNATYTFTTGTTTTLTVVENHDIHGDVVEVYQKRP